MKGVKDVSLKYATVDAVKDATSQAATEDVLPPPVAAEGGSTSSAWDKSFDPVAFVERNLLMEGDST
ncbi:hypothetical protein A2U01_0095306, partial [Trifolium medium]|nr:hypothetical protein [Trifolium medium]